MQTQNAANLTRAALRAIVAILALALLVACGNDSTTEVGEPATEEAGSESGTDATEAVTGIPAEEPDAVNAATEPGEAAQQASLVGELLPEQLQLITDPWHGDLDGMIERRVVRVLVVAGGPQYFYYKGVPRGVIAELLQMFQEELNADLGRGLDAVEIIPLPVSRDRLFPELASGHADLIAADLTITERRSRDFDFSIPGMRNVDEVFVFGPAFRTEVSSIDDLSGHSVYVRESSSYYEHLQKLNLDFMRRGMEPIRIDMANELLRTLDVAEMVNGGLVSATVLDGFKAKHWVQVYPDLDVREDLVLNSGGDIAWAFRKDSPMLEEAVNKFLRTHRQGTLIGNVLLKRYVENVRWVRNATSEEHIAKLQPVFELFRSSAGETGFDPLMLVAQAFQESGLDHSRRSSAGAVGIMQIKPSTAADRNVGIPNIDSVADNIRAGARYMRFLEDRYFSNEEMDELESWIFALAAYNAGPAKIQRMRRIAEAEGHDPNAWLDNVEIVAARKIGRETVRYVRNVFKYYVAYKLAWERRELRHSLDTEL